jgi:hypothetical protein
MVESRSGGRTGDDLLTLPVPSVAAVGLAVFHRRWSTAASWVPHRIGVAGQKVAGSNAAEGAE